MDESKIELCKLLKHGLSNDILLIFNGCFANPLVQRNKAHFHMIVKTVNQKLKV